MVYRKRYDIMYEKTTWTIKFKLDKVNKNGTYKLRLALASAQLSDLQVYLQLVIMPLLQPLDLKIYVNIQIETCFHENKTHIYF